jgi:predicted secreted protein
MRNLVWCWLILLVCLSMILSSCTKDVTESNQSITSSAANDAESLSPVPSPLPLKEYGYSDTSIIVSVDEQFQIRVEDNPSTGYIWQDVVFDNSMLQLVNDSLGPLFPEENTKIPPPPGRGFLRIYTYKALQAGSTQIKIIHKAPSGPQNDQVLTFYVTIQ